MSIFRSIRSCCVGVVMLLSLVRIPGEAQEQKTLRSFGVEVKHGQPVRPYPSTVALGLFNPDPLLDLAWYDEGQGKVQVWQNLGNGTFGTEPVWEKRSNEVVEKMEFKKTRMFTETIFDKNSWADLILTYADGRTETISHEWILNANNGFSSMPQSTSNFPPLNFTEKWRSERNPGSCLQVDVGDIDNDGKTEMVYMFYPDVGDTNGVNRLVVYKCFRIDSIVIDWDTTITTFNAGYGFSDIDKDGHKEIILTYKLRGIGVLPTVAFLECYGPRQYRFFNSNLGYDRLLFKAMETDVNHNGVKEITALTSDGNAMGDRTLIYVAEFSSKTLLPNGQGFISFGSGTLARFSGYAFDLAVGQMDGEGWDDLVPAGGSFGFNEPVPVHYLSYSAALGTWRTREIYTGLQSGTGAVMFANLDADTNKEFISGAPGPIGHGSLFALKWQHDTTWSVMWADSTTIRNAPLWVNVGNIAGQHVVAGANTWNPNYDTVWSSLNFYSLIGQPLGAWHRDSISIQQFFFTKLAQDTISNLLFAQYSYPNWLGSRLEVFGVSGVTTVPPANEFPQQLSLSQNYPNPFNPTTTIRFTLPKQGNARLVVYDLLGRNVEILLNEEKNAGMHVLHWNGSKHSTGVYFYQLETQTGVLTKRMVLIK